MVLMIALFCSGFSNEETWVIDSRSKLTIKGSTNVNNFTCAVNAYPGNDTLRYTKDYSSCHLLFTTNRMTIPIKHFNCGSRQISKDFWATLKSNQYPDLYINFISIQDSSLRDNSFVNGVVDITLAGTTARYTIKFCMQEKGSAVFLSGTHRVNFADFKLSAPEKLNGLIRVQDALNVEFHLVLRAV